MKPSTTTTHQTPTATTTTTKGMITRGSGGGTTSTLSTTTRRCAAAATIKIVVYYNCFSLSAIAALVVASAGRLPVWSLRQGAAAAQQQQRRWQTLSPFFSSSSSTRSVSDHNVCSSSKVEVNDKATKRLDEAKLALLSFLQDQSGGSGGRNEEPEEFHIQGWRWHTMSLIREASRLAKTAQKLKDEDGDWDDFCQAADYVVNFNMRGLHKIESTLFFPWARQRIAAQLSLLTATTTTAAWQQQQQDVTGAFDTVMDHLESQRQTVEQLGVTLNGLLVSSSSMSSSKKKSQKSDGPLHDYDNNDDDTTTLLLDRVASTSSAISQYTQNMLELEEALLVPVVARLVSASEQRAFNNKVIWNLGVLDSRLHLVGMHQAVYSSSSSSSLSFNTNTALSSKHETQKKMKKEQRLFEQVIPSIPQRMIPRWKRLMYDPQVAIFQRILHDE